MTNNTTTEEMHRGTSPQACDDKMFGIPLDELKETPLQNIAARLTEQAKGLQESVEELNELVGKPLITS